MTPEEKGRKGGEDISREGVFIRARPRRYGAAGDPARELEHYGVFIGGGPERGKRPVPPGVNRESPKDLEELPAESSPPPENPPPPATLSPPDFPPPPPPENPPAEPPVKPAPENPPPNPPPAPRGETPPPPVIQKPAVPEPAGKAVRVRFPIGAKLVSLITVLLFLSLGLITALLWFFGSSDIGGTAEDNNFNVNQRALRITQNFLDTIQNSAALLLHGGKSAVPGGDVSEERTAFFFSRNPEIVAVAEYSSGVLWLNERFFVSRVFDPPRAEGVIRDHEHELRREAAALFPEGEKSILNGSSWFEGLPLLVLVSSSGAVFFSPETLAEIFSSGTNVSFMLNRGGEILISPEGASEGGGIGGAGGPAGMELIQKLRSGEEGNLRIRYTENREPLGSLAGEMRDALLGGSFKWDAFWERLRGRRFFGAAGKLSTGGAMIGTIIGADVVFEGLWTTVRRNLYLSLTVWALGVLIMYYLAKTITGPLRILRFAVERIEDGQYIGNIKNRNRDETGVLTAGVNSMSNVFANFEMFTNKTIARLARRGKLSPGGAGREATVLFQDIRSFTAMSEKLSPEEVVKFLDDYMDRMVACVNCSGGVIDKFIGDAIMAHWGAIESAGSPARDALNGVRTALMMRAVLRNFNASRGSEKTPIIKTGCGLNTGYLVAGQIGSDEHLDYTVIGDTVRLADRTETFNKPFGSDILITENTWKLIGHYLVTEEMPALGNRGRKLRLFAVINMGDGGETERLLAALDGMPDTSPAINRECLGPRGPRSMAELRGLLDIPAPDLRGLNTDEEEKKYRVREKP